MLYRKRRLPLQRQHQVHQRQLPSYLSLLQWEYGCLNLIVSYRALQIVQDALDGKCRFPLLSSIFHTLQQLFEGNDDHPHSQSHPGWYYDRHNSQIILS